MPIVNISITNPYARQILQPEVELEYGGRIRAITVAELERWRTAAARVSLRAFDIPIVRATLIVGEFDLQWRLEAIVADRDSEERRPLQITFGSRVPVPPSAETADLCGYIAASLRMAVNQWLEHELDECILIDGVRPFDPHREGRREDGEDVSRALAGHTRP